jgi:hypothetical protein
VVNWTGILAQGAATQDRVRDISVSFDDRQYAVGADWVNILLLVALALVILGVALEWMRRHRRAPELRDPRELFAEALASLGLNAADKSVLERLAGEMQIDNPLTLLLDPAQFRDATERWLWRVNPQEEGVLRRQLARIRHQAFAAQDAAVQ